MVAAGPAAAGDGWPAYGGDPGGARYSTAAQITPDNVSKLELAWTARTGLAGDPETLKRSAFEATPILVDGRLILCSPVNEVLALDPGTGQQLWRYDPGIDRRSRPANQFVCRGVSVWRNRTALHDGACTVRIFMGTNDARLIALDAHTGALCSGFGENGQVRLDPGKPLVWPGEYQITSPPAVIGDLVIVGSAISDNARRDAPSGVVRAYDAFSGRLRWTFDPVPRRRSDPAAESWPQDTVPVEGQANVWAPISVDVERELIFLPTSSPGPDFYGGERAGDNRYANSVVALKASTGALAWHFQTVHHDLWDYDLPAQPGVYTIARDGTTIPVIVQVTKTGLVFVLHRETGEPIFPVEERTVPQDAVPGEMPAPTQPFPVKPAPLHPHRLTPDDAWGVTFWDKGRCRKRMAEYRSEGIFTPPSLEGTILFPFTGGGANWGGTAFDPQSNRLYVNTSRMVHVVTLFPADQYDRMRRIYPTTEVSPQKGTAYGMMRQVLLSPLGLPCNPPPWGLLHAIDLSTGELAWESVLGTTRDLTPLGLAFEWGTPNLGGPIVTAGGLVFIGAAMDNYLRAFDAETGEEVWKGRLPAGGQATPMTYMHEGRQFVVIAAGGHARAGTKLGDYILAFALGKQADD